jgi:hypothetical protein
MQLEDITYGLKKTKNKNKNKNKNLEDITYLKGKEIES